MPSPERRAAAKSPVHAPAAGVTSSLRPESPRRDERRAAAQAAAKTRWAEWARKKSG